MTEGWTIGLGRGIILDLLDAQDIQWDGTHFSD